MSTSPQPEGATRRRAVRRAALTLFLVVVGLPGLAVGLAALLGRWVAWADGAADLSQAALVVGLATLALWGITGGAPRWLGAGLILAVALNALAAGPELAAGALDRFGHVPPGPSDLTVMTFNTWDLSPDRTRTIDTILASGADIVTVQEGVGILKHALPRLNGRYPYHATCATWWGCEILILSRRPLTRLGWAVGEPERGGAPYSYVSVQTTAPDGRPLVIISTHLGHPWPVALRRGQVESLARLAAASHPADLILTGDFNTTGATQAMRRQDALLRPLTRRTRGVATWPAYLPGIAPPVPLPLLGIDQIYAGPEWRTVALSRLSHGGSDHYPLRVRFSRRPPS
jgi:vancomycin resistance protein VanJ